MIHRNDGTFFFNRSMTARAVGYLHAPAGDFTDVGTLLQRLDTCLFLRKVTPWGTAQERLKFCADLSVPGVFIGVAQLDSSVPRYRQPF